MDCHEQAFEVRDSKLVLVHKTAINFNYAFAAIKYDIGVFQPKF